MSAFKVGDRVVHDIYGKGTVLRWRDARGNSGRSQVVDVAWDKGGAARMWSKALKPEATPLEEQFPVGSRWRNGSGDDFSIEAHIKGHLVRSWWTGYVSTVALDLARAEVERGNWTKVEPPVIDPDTVWMVSTDGTRLFAEHTPKDGKPRKYVRITAYEEVNP